MAFLKMGVRRSPLVPNLRVGTSFPSHFEYVRNGQEMGVRHSFMFAFVGAFVYAALITGKPRHHY